MTAAANREFNMPGTGRRAPACIDALLPADMAVKAEHVGVEKTRFDAMTLLALATLAGAFIAFGSFLDRCDGWC
jgi:hypothetical protein